MEITLSPPLLGIPNTLERQYMYLTTGDMLAVIIALVVSVTLVITTVLENARLQKRIQRLRSERYEVTKSYEAILADLEAK